MDVMQQQKPRRKLAKPWVFLFVDAFESAQLRFGSPERLRRAVDELAAQYRLHNPAGEVPLIGGVALMERGDDDGRPRCLAVYYGPGDERNTVAKDPVPEARAVVRGPWGSSSSPLPMAARERGEL